MANPLPLGLVTGDWLKDPNLSSCTAHTRGIWIDLLCAMHEQGRRGILQGTPDQLSRLCRSSVPEFLRATDELKSTFTADITVRHGNVTLICRRMRRDWQDREQARVRQNRKRKGEQQNGACHAFCTAPVTAMSQSAPVSSSSSGRDKTFPSPLSPFPSELDVPEFLRSWEEWEGYRKERRHALTNRTRKKQLEMLAMHGVEAAIAMIEQSIRNGWQGLFPVDRDGMPRKPNTQREQAEYAAWKEKMDGTDAPAQH